METEIKQKIESLKKRFDRVLPVGEYYSDRWEKARLLNFGDKTSVYDSSYIYGNPKVGKEVWIGPFTIIDASAGTIEIGNHTSIASGTYIYTHDTSKQYASENNLPKEIGNVYIGNNTSIGSKCIICPNVSIGNNCIIGANSFVNKNIPDNSVAFGTPIKIVGKLIIDGNKTHIEYFK